MVETKFRIDKEALDTTPRNCGFSDVNKNEWFSGYVCSAKEEDIINGYPDGTFKPANSINFVEASKIIVNAFSIKKDEEHNQLWWEPYVYGLAKKVDLSYFIDENGEYKTEDSLTRGQMAYLIYNVINEKDIK